MKVIKWLTSEEAEDIPESIGGLGGWFNFCESGQRWKDYIGNMPEEQRVYAEALKEEIIINNFRFGGDQHQIDKVPLFEDGTCGSFSFRAWGDLMAAIWSEVEDKDYNYMDFYCCCG